MKPARKADYYVWIESEEYEYLKGRDDRLMQLEDQGEQFLQAVVDGVKI